MRKRMSENRIDHKQSRTAAQAAALAQEQGYGSCGARWPAAASRSAGCSFRPHIDRWHSDNRGIACFRGPLDRRQSMRAVIDRLLDEPRARPCDREESASRISPDLNPPERALGLRIAGAGCGIWGRSWSTPSKMTAVSPCMPALTARQRSVKIMLDWEEDVVGGLDVEPEGPGRPGLVSHEQAVNLACNRMLVGELYDVAAARVLFRWHRRLDGERFFIEAEPGWLSQKIHGWPPHKLDLANCTSGSFPHTTCSGFVRCQPGGAEADGNRGKLKRHPVDVPSAANWVHSGKRRAASRHRDLRMNSKDISDQQVRSSGHSHFGPNHQSGESEG